MNAWYYFLLTLLLEIPVVLYGYREEWKIAGVTCFGLNLFTWPLLHYFLLSTDLPLPAMETGVLLAEMTGYRLLLSGGWTKAFVVALLANGLSYGAGMLINTFLL